MSYQVTKPGCLFIWCYNIGFITYLFYQLLVHVWFRCVRFSFISTALSDCLRKHHRKDQLLCTVGWLVDWLIKLRFYVPLDTECVILEMLFPARLFWLMDIRPQSVFLSFFRYILDLKQYSFFWPLGAMLSNQFALCVCLWVWPPTYRCRLSRMAVTIRIFLF